MRTLTNKDVQRLAVTDLRPGMILTEGTLVEALPQGDLTFLYFAGGHVAYVKRTDLVQVVARLSDGLTENVLRTHAESNA